MYRQFRTPKRRAKTESDLDSPDGVMDVDNDEENMPVDPKLLKDIDHLTKIENKSGVGKVGVNLCRLYFNLKLLKGIAHLSKTENVLEVGKVGGNYIAYSHKPIKVE